MTKAGVLWTGHVSGGLGTVALASCSACGWVYLARESDWAGMEEAGAALDAHFEDCHAKHVPDSGRK
jgi:rubredoxin